MAIPGLQFPAAIDTDSSLFVAANNFGTLLTSTITNITANITLDSVVGLPPSGFVTIENEVVYYPSISGNTLQSCDRGVDGTTATGHNSGVAISHYVIAMHHNRLKDAIIAIITALGANLANVAKLGTKVSRSNNTIYEALTDGIVEAGAHISSDAVVVYGYCDSSNPPTTLVRAAHHYYPASGVRYYPLPSFTVKKGQFWRVDGCTYVNWIPLGN